jgi:serine phosphatase RsbU (regulator of sigma subunit)
MLNKTVKIAIILAGSLSLLVAVLLSIQEVSTFLIWKSSGIINTDFVQRADSTVVFSGVDSTDFNIAPVPDSGDVIITMGNTTASIDYIRKNIFKGYSPGKQIALSYIHKGDTLSTIIKTKPVKKTEILQDLPITVLRLLIVFGYLVVGFWAFVKRPNLGAIHALVLFCIAMVSFMVVAVRIDRDSIEGFQIPIYHALTAILSTLVTFFGAFWLNLQLLFPKPSKLMLKHPYITYSLCYLPIIFLILIQRFFELNSIGGVIISVIMIQVWAGFIILARNHRKATSSLERRQTRLVLWGTGIGFFGMFVLLVIGLFFRVWFIGLSSKYILGAIILEFLALLLSPLSFAYAFGRYRLLEVEGKIRRGTRFVIVTIVLLFVFYLTIYGISELLLGSMGIESRGSVLLIALLIALGFIPAQRKFQVLVESKVFPERIRLRQMLRDFLSQAVTYADKNAFWNELETHLKDILKVENIYTLLYREEGNAFVNWQNESDSPFTSDSQLTHALSGLTSCPLMLDEALASKKIKLSAAEESWLDQRNIAMVLPLQTRSRLVGFIGLGFKSEREDFNSEECSMLMSIASQVAIAAENLQLLEENIEKQRLEKELGMARRIQQGLLPSKIPDSPGLEIATRSRFCLEVAGDYYDVIRVDDRRTVMAIGDVSGKGAAAALLMSNIQASFRIAVGLGSQAADPKTGLNISDVVSRINDLIFRNTPPDQFITFFVGVFDSESKTFSHVNAGHNPPILLRASGQIELLDKGGLLLGAMSNMPYEQGITILEGKDLIFLYTDGVSEAENVNGEMFGEERIKSILEENRDFTPEEILSKLEDEVKYFIGDVPLSDDFTTLVARVIP